MSDRLALTLPLRPRETAYSFLSRLAARNGIVTREFASDMGVAFGTVVDAKRTALERLAHLSGAALADLMAWSPVHVGDRHHQFRGETFHARGLKEPTVRGCPVCLREDVDASSLSPAEAMAFRGHWMPRHVTLCLYHRHPLVPLWSETDPGRRYDVAARMADISEAVLAGKLDRPLRDPAPFDLWFERRLSDGPNDDWLDQFPLFPAAHFCELLGRAAFATRIPKWKGLPDDVVWCCFDAGFRFSSPGEAAIRKALSEMQEMIGTPMDGPKKKFGDLYDRLAHDLTSDEYRPFRNLLRDHIAETWPLGPGDELMGEPVNARRLHSVRTASQATGVDARRLRKLLSEAGWVKPAGEGREDAWELFDAVAAEPFLRSLATCVSALDLQRQLNIPRSQFDLLRQDGYFEPTVVGSGHKPLWDVQGGWAFLDSLLAGAEAVYVPMHDWCDIAKAAQRLKIRPGEIVGMIEARQLSRVGKHLGRDGYTAILVNLAEVERLLGRPEARGSSIELFAKSVGMRPAIAMRMVRAGLITTTTGVNPRTKAAQQYLGAEDIEAFRRRFVTLRQLAASLFMSWQTVSASLANAGVPPFAPGGDDFGALYEWSAIETSFCCIWPRSDAGSSRARGQPDRSPHVANSRRQGLDPE